LAARFNERHCHSPPFRLDAAPRGVSPSHCHGFRRHRRCLQDRRAWDVHQVLRLA
jgi:hypothetical protein